MPEKAQGSEASKKRRGLINFVTWTKKKKSTRNRNVREICEKVEKMMENILKVTRLL